MTKELERQIDEIIRGHYFNDDCKHRNYPECCKNIVSKIMKVINYKTRVSERME